MVAVKFFALSKQQTTLTVFKKHYWKLPKKSYFRENFTIVSNFQDE